MDFKTVDGETYTKLLKLLREYTSKEELGPSNDYHLIEYHRGYADGQRDIALAILQDLGEDNAR